MLLPFWRVVTATLVALSMGASFAHVLELPGKLTLTAGQYLVVQSIYRYFGPVASALEPLCLVLLIWLAVATRRQAPHRSVRWIVLAAITFALGLVTWFTVVAPMNSEMASWSGHAPASWAAARDRWEWGHVTVFGLKLVTFLMLLGQLVARHDVDDDEAIWT